LNARWTSASLAAIAALVAGISCTQGPRGDATEGPPADGGAFWSAECAACHAAPHAESARDATWISLVAVTGCLDVSRGAGVPERAIVMEFLREGRGARWARSSAAGPGEGTVRAPDGRGHAVLAAVAEPSLELRLEWDSAGRTFAVPAGRWRLRGYIVEAGAAGAPDLVSASGIKGPELDIEAGESLDLPILPEVEVETGSFRADGGALVLTAVVRGFGGLGASVTRRNQPMKAEFELLGADGTVTGRIEASYG
jgi:hypothetical protein